MDVKRKKREKAHNRHPWKYGDQKQPDWFGSLKAGPNIEENVANVIYTFFLTDSTACL